MYSSRQSLTIPGTEPDSKSKWTYPSPKMSTLFCIYNDCAFSMGGPSIQLGMHSKFAHHITPQQFSHDFELSMIQLSSKVWQTEKAKTFSYNFIIYTIHVRTQIICVPIHLLLTNTSKGTKAISKPVISRLSLVDWWYFHKMSAYIMGKKNNVIWIQIAECKLTS